MGRLSGAGHLAGSFALARVRVAGASMPDSTASCGSCVETGRNISAQTGAMRFLRAAGLACVLVLASRCVASFGLQGKEQTRRQYPGRWIDLLSSRMR